MMPYSSKATVSWSRFSALVSLSLLISLLSHPLCNSLVSFALLICHHYYACSSFRLSLSPTSRLHPSLFHLFILHIIVTYSYHFNCRIFIRRFSSFPIVAVPSSRLIRLVLQHLLKVLPPPIPHYTRIFKVPVRTNSLPCVPGFRSTVGVRHFWIITNPSPSIMICNASVHRSLGLYRTQVDSPTRTCVRWTPKCFRIGLMMYLFVFVKNKESARIPFFQKILRVLLQTSSTTNSNSKRGYSNREEDTRQVHSRATSIELRQSSIQQVYQQASRVSMYKSKPDIRTCAKREGKRNYRNGG